jgi:hypothetical protein
MEAHRKYVVQDAPASMKEKNPYNQYQLVALRDDVLETVICYGYRKETLQVIADKRNQDHTAMYENLTKQERKLNIPAENKEATDN